VIWVQGMRACVNFIRWNPVEGLPFAPASIERAVAMRERVKSRGIVATIRASTGADVDAACGQLRRRTEDAAVTARRAPGS
jgi:23S rRNA (adenine2503-C2)-methyltransferase